MNENDGEILRAMWRHEDTLANNRLGWFNTIQGLLFTALTIFYNVKATGEPGPELKTLLSIVGIGVSVLTELSLIVGVQAKHSLLKWYEENKQEYKGPPIVGYYPTASFKI